MAVTVLTDLIDKQDNFEIVRDQIAAILFADQAEQQVLALAAAEDPALWKLRVFTERQNTIEAYLNAPDLVSPDLSPVVNVWYDSGTFDQSIGDVVKRQATRAVFNIDVYGFAIAEELPAGAGQKPGDVEAVFTAQRGVRLVRNILMSAQNIKLQLQPDIWQRWIRAIESFQTSENMAAHQIVANRVVLEVTFNEYSPQFTSIPLAQISVDIFRDSDGMLIAESDYVFP